MTKAIPPLDLSWLLIESPASTTHVGAMLLFKKPAGRGPVVREIVEAYRAYRPAPPFNYVPELLGVPHFREVASWDPHYHIQHLSLPTRASYDDLLRLVADLHEPQLDRDRPLFRCWMIDGVPGGMFAIYTKSHHSIIDGESGMKSLYAGLSKSARHTVAKPGFALGLPAPTPRPPTPVAARIADSIRAVVTQVEAVNQISLGALRKTLTGLARWHLDGSLPFAAPHAPTNEPLKMGRRFATLALPLEEMHEVGRQFGATLNDVAVTVVTPGCMPTCAKPGAPLRTHSSRCVRCRCVPTATRRSARGYRQCLCDSASPPRPCRSGSGRWWTQSPRPRRSWAACRPTRR
jgi:WS/DGAT/MGAT family acyltransferase